MMSVGPTITTAPARAVCAAFGPYELAGIETILPEIGAGAAVATGVGVDVEIGGVMDDDEEPSLPPPPHAEKVSAETITIAEA